jgi:hypothetical protein
METKHLSTKTTAIEKVKQRFETWREVRKKRTKIPEELWQAAVELSSDYPLNKISQTLHLNYSVLKERIVSMKTEKLGVKGAVGGFVEVDLGRRMSTEEWAFELEDGKGAKMRMRMKGGAGVDLIEIAKVLWGKVG